MNDDLLEFVSRELRLASADTADCPNLVHRVAAGVRRRQRRQRRLGAGLATVLTAVLTTTLLVGPSLGGSSSSSVTALRAGTSARAELALRRANPEVAAPVHVGGDPASCARPPYCRRPV